MVSLVARGLEPGAQCCRLPNPSPRPGEAQRFSAPHSPPAASVEGPRFLKHRLRRSAVRFVSALKNQAQVVSLAPGFQFTRFEAEDNFY
ncbi:unnamed protein product [Rangifer tarandus platyrhynchus]|uniref:Uncharacterized protein n=2 Tax=Rangifer tarandus platyrhynchus TaxID=3082113 RepID=A0ACB0E7Y9_RANTA|nr:unnamed protein product [Rangifer tarandus platyrhynchus]CAI9696665.1 unnamed protein product [Rangifer tarandus platyrhynchus]